MNKIKELEEFVRSLSSSVDELTIEVFILKKRISELEKRALNQQH